MTERQPVHTVYGGAHLFKAEIAVALGAKALETMRTYAPAPSAFAEFVGLRGNEELVRAVYQRTIAKLEREPVEDYRIDFEDGYGNRTDTEEDAHAVSAAQAVAQGAPSPAFRRSSASASSPSLKRCARVVFAHWIFS